MRPTASEVTRWLFLDIATRQDENGVGAKRGHRRYRQGRRMLIYSRRVLERDAPQEMWGIAYQDGNKRVRGNDLLYRLTISVLAFEQEGSSRQEACRVVVAEPAVAQKCGYRGTSKEIDRLRVQVIAYVNRREKDGINLHNDLRSMQEWWRWNHMSILAGGEWYREYERDYKGRIREAKATFSGRHWAYLMGLLGLAQLYREGNRYGEAGRLYRKVYCTLKRGKVRTPDNDVILRWLRAMRWTEIGREPVLVRKEGKLIVANRNSKPVQS